MIPVSLTLKNFLSYGEDVPTLDFTPLHVVCLSGDNGHGKSALLDAITWAVWGEARKAAGDRKPDERLLRMGATDMAVEFTFDLEGDRYRILRQYRAGRSAKSALEFQIFSPESESYHSLTLTGITATQQRIVETIRMDLETFINSVFILQGRANEFTRRSARERKDILAEILGLDRYDRLAEQAREKAGAARKEIEALEGQLEQIDRALEEQDDCRQIIEALNTEREEKTVQIRDIDGERESLQKKQVEQNANRREISRIQQRHASLNEENENLKKQMSAQQIEIDAYKTALGEREAIEKRYETYLELKNEAEGFIRLLPKLRTLDRKKHECERDIENARQEIRQRINTLATKAESLRSAVKEYTQTLIREAEIEKNYQDLLRGRRVDEQWDEKRRRHLELDGQLRKIQENIRKEQTVVEGELAGCRHRLDELKKRAGALESVRKQVAELQERAAFRETLEAEQKKITERGQELNGHIEVLKNKIKLYEHDDEESRTKLKVLKRGTKANCPLCDAALDDRRRATIEANLGDTLGQHAVEIQKFERGIHIAEEEKKDLAVRYKTIRPQIDGLSEVQKGMARAEAALKDADDARQQSLIVQRRIDELQRILDKRLFAPELQSAMDDLSHRIAQLGCDEDKHQALKRKIRELSRYEVDKRSLDDARKQHAEAGVQLADIERQRADEQERLDTRAYASEAFEQLKNVEMEIERLGYNENRHQEIKDRLDASTEVVARKEALDQAIRQYDSALASLEDKRTRAQKYVEEIGGLQTRLEELEASMGDAADLEKRLNFLKDDRKQLQEELDDINRRLGAEQQKEKRSADLRSKKPEIEQKKRQAARDQQIYEQLTIAFGKDGIPALIIENAIPDIEEEANQILSRLTGNRTHITIEPLRNLKTGGTRETLDIHISDEMGTRPYEMFSGGEAFRTDFSLRIALSKLLAHRAGTRLRTLAIDEGFGTQDAQGLEYLIDALRSIQDDFEKIIVVTHLERLKNAFPARIEVTKHPDIGSRFEVFM